MKAEYEFYVALSPTGKYYMSYEEWIPEGDKLIIEETLDIEYADEFKTPEEVYGFKKNVDESRYLYEGHYTVATGEFEPVKIKKFKKIYQEISE